MSQLLDHQMRLNFSSASTRSRRTFGVTSHHHRLQLTALKERLWLRFRMLPLVFLLAWIVRVVLLLVFLLARSLLLWQSVCISWRHPWPLWQSACNSSSLRSTRRTRRRRGSGKGLGIAPVGLSRQAARRTRRRRGSGKGLEVYICGAIINFQTVY